MLFKFLDFMNDLFRLEMKKKIVKIIFYFFSVCVWRVKQKEFWNETNVTIEEKNLNQKYI